ncbi:MAG TPA: hypothetical protein DHW15_01255 [Bacteroidetes bacterium]|jgi:hypothetical protein|nr:MAG: hypothetical protein ABR95_01250 [Sphingobacteriales bacterium BACL12 MAG-120813-bin55]HCK20824.1 hypothetical protein [Bacteroidota bacterium]
MNAQQRILATLAGTVVSFLMGYILYALALGSFFEAHMGTAENVAKTDDMVWWALVAGNVFLAYLLVYIFGKWANIKTFGAGLQAGAMIGLIIGFGYDMIAFGTTNTMDLTAALVDPFVTAVMLGVTGGVVGWMLGRGK